MPEAAGIPELDLTALLDAEAPRTNLSLDGWLCHSHEHSCRCTAVEHGGKSIKLMTRRSASDRSAVSMIVLRGSPTCSIGVMEMPIPCTSARKEGFALKQGQGFVRGLFR
jgi:hypothetical protein